MKVSCLSVDGARHIALSRNSPFLIVNNNISAQNIGILTRSLIFVDKSLLYSTLKHLFVADSDIDTYFGIRCTSTLKDNLKLGVSFKIWLILVNLKKKKKKNKKCVASILGSLLKNLVTRTLPLLFETVVTVTVTLNWGKVTHYFPLFFVTFACMRPHIPYAIFI